MSTIKVTNLQDTSGGNSSTCEQIAKGRATAWVNFDGTGTIAIRDSFNVTSLTDNNTGDYTVNFTNSFGNTNYCFQLSCTDSGSGGNQTDGYTYGGWKRGSDSTLRNTNTVRFKVGYTANNVYYDQSEVMVTIFGG